MDVSVPKLADIPSVPYDQAQDTEGIDTFARHHAPVIAIKEQIKATKLKQKEARRADDIEAFKAAIAEREELQRLMAEAEVKAVITTLNEKHQDKNLDEVLDLHGLRGKEAKLVVERQVPAIEKKVSSGALAANTEAGYVYCIVTGKGMHGTRCVLKPLVERYLIKEGYTYAELDNGAGYKVLFE
jgi:DNA-nicking Smr family endonuclease